MKNGNIKYLGVVLNAAFVLFMVKLDAFVVYVSLPTIAADFAINAARVSYVVVAYLLMLTSTMLIFGKIEDRVGIKKLQAGGYFIFTIGSLLCGLTPGIIALVIWRAIQGMGGALMLTTAFASVNKYMPENKKGWSLGIVTTAAALGIATGAPLGGFITDFLSWRWIFFINLPLGVLGILFTLKVVPADTQCPKTKFKKFDFVGAILSFLIICGVSYLMTEGSKAAMTLPFFISLLAGLICSIICFVIWETKYPDPLLDFRIFKNRGFAFGNVALFTIFMVLSGIDFIIPFYLELAENFKTYQVGLFMFLYSTVYSVCAPYAGKLADDKKFIFMGPLATLLAAFACILFALTIQIPGVWCGIIFIIIWAITNAVFIPQNNRLIFINIPEDMQGVGSGVFNTFNNLSMIFGVCSFQIIFSNITHSPAISDAQSMAKSGHSLGLLFIAFRNIFIFAGILYLATLVFNILAQRVSYKTK
jgi:DHA2 family metal-tetracycline-proton antiporter-like MFS transporter